jgi:chemotaxis response regulator CheB
MLVVQEPGTAESQEMPAAVLAATQVDAILPLGKIAGCLNAVCRAPQG